MAWLAFILGALIPTFLLSRLVLWFTKTWDGNYRRLILVHSMALLIASLLGGMGMADGGAFAGAQALATYFLPQLVWLAIDCYRQWRTNSAIAGADSSNPETV